MTKHIITAAGLLVALAHTMPAAACVTCAVGDPTLTVMGDGQSLAGRVRLLVEYRHRLEGAGLGPSLESITESRVNLGAAWSPAGWVTLSLTAPLVHKRVEYADLSADEVTSLGDLELSARFTVLNERLGGRHRLGLSAQLTAPTAIRQETQVGRSPLDAQAGLGAVAAGGGIFYAFSRDPWSVFVSASGRAYSRGWDRFLAGPALLATARVQAQPTRWLGLQLGFEMRSTVPNTRGDAEDPDSGGTVILVSPGLVLSPVTDLIVHANLGITIANHLRGAQRDPLTASLGVTYDF